MTYHPAPVTKTELLAQMLSAINAYEQVIAQLSVDQMLDTDMDNGVSFKDLLAHLSAWVHLELSWLEASFRGEHAERYAPGFELTDTDPEDVINHLNGAIYQAHKDDSLPDVLRDFRLSHQRLYTLVQALPESMLNNPQAFDWWRGEPVWTSIAHNSYLHFQDHLDGIRGWLEQTQSAPTQA